MSSVRWIPAFTLPSLQRQQKIGASQRLHGRVHRTQVYELRRGWSRALSALLLLMIIGNFRRHPRESRTRKQSNKVLLRLTLARNDGLFFIALSIVI